MNATSALRSSIDTPALYRSSTWNDGNSVNSATKKFMAAHTGA